MEHRTTCPPPFPFTPRPYPKPTRQQMDLALPATVPMCQLTATQDWIRIASVCDITQSPNAMPGAICPDGYREDRPYIVRWQGRLYIEDGLHRLTALRLKGRDWANVYLLEI